MRRWHHYGCDAIIITDAAATSSNVLIIQELVPHAIATIIYSGTGIFQELMAQSGIYLIHWEEVVDQCQTNPEEALQWHINVPVDECLLMPFHTPATSCVGRLGGAPSSSGYVCFLAVVKLELGLCLSWTLILILAIFLES